MRRSLFLGRRALRSVRPWPLVAALLASPACQSVPAAPDRVLTQSLQVADAALAADQMAVARRLYQSLADRFPDDPAPRLRLAYVAFELGDFPVARAEFLEVASRSAEERMQAEAWYGAGRAALALEDAGGAAEHFRRARALITDAAAAAWVANGLALAAMIEKDWSSAEARYEEALALAPESPQIAANFVRLLLASGQADRAAEFFAGRGTRFWSPDDKQALQRLFRTHEGQ